MPRPAPRRNPLAEPPDILGGKALDALRAGRFKEAIELLKPLVKADPRPEWRDHLGDAYMGRAKALAAKGMIREASGVLDNALAMHGTCKDPLFFLRCLIHEGQFDKARTLALAWVGTGSPPAGQGPALAEAAAALYLMAPVDLEPVADEPSPRGKWHDAARAARAALDAWCEGKSEDEIDSLLARVSLRSSFKAVRLILKGLLCLSHDPGKAKLLLDGVEAGSPFAALKAAALGALPREPADRLQALSLATGPQRSFLDEVSGGQRHAPQSLARLLEAERAGPAALLSFLLKHLTHFPSTEARAACFNLLPLVPNHIAAFEKTFGALSDAEKRRILALSAEAGGDWHRAETQWCKAAEAFQRDGSREGTLAAGVIYRHLARLAPKHAEIEGDDYATEPELFYLTKCVAADPDHLPSVLELIDALRREGEDKAWHGLTEEAARRFPDESGVLLRAVDSAAARKAYKKAAGFARKLLALDPINQPARQRMIDLQIAHARKQMRAKRPDLAWKELSAAEQWEPAGSPNAALRLNQGLVGLRLDQGADAEARLREGVALAGGPVVGWFRAALHEAMLMPPRQAPHRIVGDELRRLLTLRPDRAQIAAIVAALNASDVRADQKATHDLCWKFSRWMQHATDLPVPAAEFHALAEVILRAQAYDILAAFARAAKHREPGEPAWRFYEIVARTQNNPDWMHYAEQEALLDMQERAGPTKDFPWFNRIQRYLDSAGDDPAAKRRAKHRARMSSISEEEDALRDMLAQALQDLPPREVNRMIKKHGKDRACTLLRDRLVASPLGAMIPPDLVERIARNLVDTAETYQNLPF